MIENKYGLVGGSIDRARLAELLATTSDPDVKAQLEQVAAEHGVSVERPEPEPAVEEPPAEDLSKLTKAELVERADFDTEGMTKAEIIDALNGKG